MMPGDTLGFIEVRDTLELRKSSKPQKIMRLNKTQEKFGNLKHKNLFLKDSCFGFNTLVEEKYLNMKTVSLMTYIAKWHRHFFTFRTEHCFYKSCLLTERIK